MLAVIETGGKQYLVSPKDKIKIDPPASLQEALRTGKIEGKEITFSKVLLLEKGKQIEIGNPLIKEVKVIGRILRQGKGKKIIVFKFRKKTRYQLKKGHRQPFIEVEILKIETD